MVEECVFCKITEGEIPAFKVYEDRNTLAFLDINPCSPGHTVVIPKKHFKLLTEMSELSVRDLWAAAWLVEKGVRDAMGADGVNVGVNDGEVAGQGVPHVHLHVIPRFRNDKGGSMHSIVRTEVPREQLPGHADKIKRALQGATLEEGAPEPKLEKKTQAKPKSQKKWYFFEK